MVSLASGESKFQGSNFPVSISSRQRFPSNRVSHSIQAFQSIPAVVPVAGLEAAAEQDQILHQILVRIQAPVKIRPVIRVHNPDITVDVIIIGMFGLDTSDTMFHARLSSLPVCCRTLVAVTQRLSFSHGFRRSYFRATLIC